MSDIEDEKDNLSENSYIEDEDEDEVNSEVESISIMEDELEEGLEFENLEELEKIRIINN